nr:MAG TPA: hypothetical protein [Caudoviricetes sp.]
MKVSLYFNLERVGIGRLFYFVLERGDGKSINCH